MYESLLKNCVDFKLFIFTFDQKAYNVLSQLNLEKVELITLNEFEDKELLNVKPTRNVKEYYWTCTPSVILYCIEKYNLDSCTYLDADIYFFNSLDAIFSEMAEKSILITPFRFTPQYDRSDKVGKYCVQFMTFKNNMLGMKALKWWRDACLDWCYDIHEPTRYGDEKYLDDWNQRFEGVCDLKYLGAGVGHWNVQQYDLYQLDHKLLGREKETNNNFEVIFYHMQGLMFYKNNKVELAIANLPPDAIQLIYKPYLRHLEMIKKRLLSIDNTFDPNGAIESPKGIKYFLMTRRLKKQNLYNIFDLNKMVV